MRATSSGGRETPGSEGDRPDAAQVPPVQDVSLRTRFTMVGTPPQRCTPSCSMRSRTSVGIEPSGGEHQASREEELPNQRLHPADVEQGSGLQ